MLLSASGYIPDSGVDDSLLTQTGRGDGAAFSTLYRLTKNAVYAYAMSILRNPDDAEDAMQDTYLKIRAAAYLYEPQGKPMAWILTITRNVCLMRLRQQKHTCACTQEQMAREPDLNRIEDTEDRVVLRAALQVLSEEESQIIILHAVTGMRHREIGELLQLPLSTVLSKYHRGLKKLKSQLEGKP